MLINILLFALGLIRLITGIRLFLVGRKNRLANLFWLAGSMVIGVITYLFAPSDGNPLAVLPFSIWIFSAANCLSMACIIVFNQLTFYKNRKSPAIWFWAIFIVSWALTFYGASISESNYNQSPLLACYIISTVLIWSWHGWLANQAGKQVASQPLVEYWVKVRYQLISSYSIMLIVAVLGSLARIIFAAGSAASPLGTLTGAVTLLSQIVSVILLFLVWVMPEWFRLWVNRRHAEFVEEQAYEYASTVLNILGTAMADGTKLPKTLALVAIRKTIAQEINSDNSKKIEAHVAKLQYEDWYAFLSNPNLANFLREIANVNPQETLTRAKYSLRDNQSLFTLQAK